MRLVNRDRHSALLFSIFIFFILQFVTAAVRGQSIYVDPHPDHPDPFAIFLASSSVSVEIHEGVAHTTLVQVFANPNNWSAEGRYLFPLPEGAAVTDFKLTMDGVAVSGQVLDREKAASIYMDIVRRIRDPALLEYLGNRVFQARIFPFEPNGTRTLTLSYAQILPREGDYHVFRYLTGQGTSQGYRRFGRRGSSGIPVQGSPSGNINQASRFVIEGTITDDRSIQSIYSPTHKLAVEQSSPDSVYFSGEGNLLVSKGFTLYYACGVDNDIGISVMAHRPEGEDGYFLLTISPGWKEEEKTRVPRDLIFALDISGSMGSSNKLEQAIGALDFGLGTLDSQDRFGLVTYNSTVKQWRQNLTHATPRDVSEAREYIKSLEAGGGTNIEEALSQASFLAREADADDGGNGSSRPIYVVFLTDGLPTVGECDPEILIAQSGENLPHSVRLFTWGVGTNVNVYLLDHLAGNHNGSSTYIYPFQNLEVKVSAFFERISRPVLTDLNLDFDGVEVHDLFPYQLRDLFRGNQITVMGRYSRSQSPVITLGGLQDGRDRSIISRIELPEIDTTTEFLAPLWAQRKVGFLLEQIRLNGYSEELRSEVVTLGEKYGLVTPYTGYLVTEPENVTRNTAAPPADYIDRGLMNVHYRSGSGAGGNRSRISGKVTDSSTGVPLAAVNVFVLSTDDIPTSMGAFTNSEGDYVILDVPPGRYNVRASMMGYRTKSIDSLVVAAGMISGQDITLNATVLNVGEIVTVTAFRDMIQRDVTSAQVSFMIDEIERMAIASTSDILSLQTNTITLPDTSLYTNRAGISQQVGAGAVFSSSYEKALQSSTNPWDVLGDSRRRIGDKTFNLDKDTGIWRDSALEEDQELTEIVIGSEAFMDLWRQNELFVRYASLGEKVEVELDGKGFRILLP